MIRALATGLMEILPFKPSYSSPPAPAPFPTSRSLLVDRVPPTLFTQFNLYAGTPTALGALLESNVVPNSVAPGLTPGQVVNFSSVVQPLLIAGQNYWLSFTEPNAADGSSSLWFFNSQGILGTRLTNLLPAATAANAAFRISVNPVPEPNFLPVILSAMVGFFLVNRYRKPIAD